MQPFGLSCCHRNLFHLAGSIQFRLTEKGRKEGIEGGREDVRIERKRSAKKEAKSDA